MGMGRRRFWTIVIIIFLFLIIIPIITKADLSCSITTNCNGIDLFHVKNDTGGYNNAHGEVSSQNNYNYKICCYSNETINNSCSGNHLVIIRLSNETNAHAQTNNESLNPLYDYNICINSSSWKNCVYGNTCPTGYTEIISLSNITNAHIGEAGEYNTKVCCYVNYVPSHSNPTLISDDPLNRTTTNLTCYNESTLDYDNEEVENVYIWLRNNQPITLLYMPFNRNISTNATGAIKDYALENNGTLGGGNISRKPTWTNGKIGGAYSFDGIDDYIETSLTIDPSTTSISVEAWVYPNSLPSEAGIDLMILQQKDGSGTGRAWIYADNDTDTWCSYVGGSRRDSGVTIKKNEWQHLVFVWDKDEGTWTWYIDGEKVENGTMSVESADGEWIIGNHKNLLHPFKGTIDEVRIYNRSLSAEQIHELFLETNNSYNYSKLMSSEISKGESWKCKVIPVDTHDFGEAKESNSIAIENSPPTIPTLINPSNGTNVTEVIFSYSSTDTDGDSIKYYVYADDNPIPTTLIYNGTNDTYHWETNFVIGKTYYWRVKAGDGLENSSYSETYSFTYYGCGAITSPGYYNLPLDITWNYSECIVISNNVNITLNCQGHKIESIATGTGDWNHRAIKLYNADNITIKNCNISYPNWGVYLQAGSGNVTITNNTFYNCSRGLDWNEGGVVIGDNNDGSIYIYNNSFILNKNGVSMRVPATIENCTFERNENGVYGLSGSGGFIVKNSIFRNNTGKAVKFSDYGICDNCTFIKNNYYGEIYLSYAGSIGTIINNSYFNCSGTCIQLFQTENITIENSDFVEMETHSLWLYNVNNSLFKNNTFRGKKPNYAAVVFANSGAESYNNSFLKDTFKDAHYGFQIDTKYVNNTWFRDCEFDNNDYDFYLNSQTGNISETFVVNSSFNDSKVYSGENNTLWKGWYIDTHVNDSLGNNVENAVVKAYNKDNNQEWEGTTGSDGWLRRKISWEYKKNSTETYYLNNHTINVTKWNNHGIHMYKAHNVSIRNCVVKRFNWGAYINYGGNISFRNCSFYNSSRGLDWAEAGIRAANNLDDDLRVYDSVFMFNKQGIFTGSYVYVNNSYFLNNTDIGVRLEKNAGGSLIENSLFKENSGNGIRGEVWYVCNNNTFVKNNYYGEIYLSYHADDNSVIKNSFFNCTGTCVQLHDVVNVSFVNNTFVEVGTHSLWIYNLNDSSFINNSFVGGGTYAAVVFANSGVGSSNNTFISSRFHDSNIGFQTDVKPANDTWIIDSVFSGNNIDLKLDTNSSYNTSMVYLVNTSTSADIDILGNDLLFRGWYLDVLTKYANNTPAPNTNVSCYDKNNDLKFSELTNASGYIERKQLWEYKQNKTEKYYYTNYTINATKDSKRAEEEVNLSENKFITLILAGNPSVTIPTITPSPAYSNSTLNCTTFVTDPDGLNLNVTFVWINGSTIYTQETKNTNNGTYVSSLLTQGIQNKGENWTCKVRAYNGYYYSEEKNSSIVINNSAPTKPELLSPNNGEHTYDRTPFFSWNSTDIDGDPITYEINITAYEGICDNLPYYNNSISDKNFTPNFELCTDLDVGYYKWRVRARDSENLYSEWSDEYNFTVDSLIYISLVNSVVDFGELEIGESDNTTDNSPEPFEIENLGNIKINVSVNVTTPLWQSVDLGTKYYQFKADNSSEPNSFDYSQSQTEWIYANSTKVSMIKELDYHNDSNRGEIDVLIEVPINEPPGKRTSSIIFSGGLG